MGFKDVEQLAAVKIRWMLRRDNAEVFAIERSGFQYPWTESDWLKTLRQRNVIARVAECRNTGAAVGFVVYELGRRDLQIINLGVADFMRRRGIGRALVDSVRCRASDKRPIVSAEVWERNVAAQLFFRAVGFKCCGVVENADWVAQGIDGDAYFFKAGRMYAKDVAAECSGR